MVSEVCTDLWENLNSRVDFGNFNETEMENRMRSSLQIIHGYFKDVCVCVCTDERHVGGAKETGASINYNLIAISQCSKR